MPRYINTKVVGVSRRNEDGTSRQELIEELEVGDVLDLEREPYNEHDTDAVAVFRQDGQQLGYLRSELAANLAEQMDEGISADAVVLQVTGGDVERPSFGVNIRVAVYDTDDPGDAEKCRADAARKEALDRWVKEVRSSPPPPVPTRFGRLRAWIAHVLDPPDRRG